MTLDDSSQCDEGGGAFKHDPRQPFVQDSRLAQPKREGLEATTLLVVKNTMTSRTEPQG